MKAIKIDTEASHIVVLEKGDRFVQLVDTQAAVVLANDPEKEGAIKISLHFPEMEQGQDVPFPVLLAACVKEFLDDPEWVLAAQERVRKTTEQKEPAEQKESAE